MLTITPTRTGFAALDALALPWRAVGDAATALRDDWRRRRSARATRSALDALDAHLLQDLGIDRSEIPSIAAAAGGPGDPTRVRTTQLARRLTALL